MSVKSQKIFFATNIKFLRERKRISQESLASTLGLTRAKLASIEAGNTKSPQPEDYLNFSDFFKISVDTLLKIDLSKLGELKIRDLEAGNDVYIRGGNLRVLAISTNNKGKENIEMVPVKAQAGYTSNYGDLDFIASLPKFQLPFLPENKTYRSFQIKGDSMLPVTEGSWVTCSFIENWESIKNGQTCMVVTKDEGIVFKRVYEYLDEGKFQLVSTNPDYSPYEIQVAQILEIWKFETLNSFEIKA